MSELNTLTDEQVETELKTLSEKKEATADDKEKLQSLKEERATRYQKRIDRITWEKKAESEKAKKLEEELALQKKELEEDPSEAFKKRFIGKFPTEEKEKTDDDKEKK